MLLSLLLGCSDPPPAPEPAPPAAAPKAPPAPAKEPAPSEHVRFDLCDQPLEVDLWRARITPRGAVDLTIVAGRRVGPLVGGKTVDVDAMMDIGWLGKVTKGPDGAPTWLWFYTSSDLTGEQMVETYQPGFTCESYGGDGRVWTDTQGRVEKVELTDDRFRTDSPAVGIGSAIGAVRPWLCPDTCTEEWDLVRSGDWLASSAVGRGRFDGQEGHLTELTVTLGEQKGRKEPGEARGGKAGKKKAKSH